jgi:hypothetical protein
LEAGGDFANGVIAFGRHRLRRPSAGRIDLFTFDRRAIEPTVATGAETHLLSAEWHLSVKPGEEDRG